MTQATRNDPTLLERIALGDPQAVDACLDKYGALVWTVASKAGFSPASIEDVVQEVFIEVWKSAGRYDPERASEATFIATIARRRVIDRRRKEGRAPQHETIDVAPEGDLVREDKTLSKVDVGDEARLAQRALEELKPDQRRVILLSVVDGLTHQEIAEKTGIPLGTVKSHIRRGLDQTAQKLRAAKGGSR